MVVEEEGFVHKLIISNPNTNDMGKYTCDINNITTSAFLDVDGESVTRKLHSFRIYPLLFLTFNKGICWQSTLEGIMYCIFTILMTISSFRDYGNVV